VSAAHATGMTHTSGDDETPQEENARIDTESATRSAAVAVGVAKLIDEGFGDSVFASVELFLDWKAEGYTDAERRAHIVATMLSMVATRDVDREAAAAAAAAAAALTTS
jgi:hypothetical protein